MSDKKFPKPSELADQPLYEIADKYKDLVDRLEDIAEENGGVLPDDMVEDFESIEGEVSVKLESCSAYVRVLELKEGIIKAEEKRLRAWRQTIENSKNRLKQYIANNMIFMKIPRSEGDFLKVAVRKNQPKALILDINKVPDEYCFLEVKFPAAQLPLIRAMVEALVSGDASEDWLDVIGLTDDWDTTRTVKTKPIIDEWKATSGAFEVPGIEVSQGKSIRIT